LPVIFNGTSIQLGYTVPFTLVYMEKIQDRRQIKNRQYRN